MLRQTIVFGMYWHQDVSAIGSQDREESDV